MDKLIESGLESTDNSSNWAVTDRASPRCYRHISTAWAAFLQASIRELQPDAAWVELTLDVWLHAPPTAEP